MRITLAATMASVILITGWQPAFAVDVVDVSALPPLDIEHLAARLDAAERRLVMAGDSFGTSANYASLGMLTAVVSAGAGFLIMRKAAQSGGAVVGVGCGIAILFEIASIWHWREASDILARGTATERMSPFSTPEPGERKSNRNYLW